MCNKLQFERGLVLNYYKEIRENGVVYSVDMVRLKIKINFLLSQEFMNKLSSSEMEIGTYDYYQSFKLWQYRHLYNIKMGDSSVTLGVQFNDDKRIDCIDGYLEFNPNKVASCDEFLSLYSLIREYSDMIELKRWDLAIDLPCKRSALTLKKDQRLYQYIESPGGITEYLGRRSHDGFVKLYDKTKESGLDYDLTRLELTIEGFKLFSELNMPVVRVGVVQLKLDGLVELKGTDFVLYQLMLPLDDTEKNRYLKILGRRKAKILKPYLFAVDKVLELPSNVYNNLVHALRLYTKPKVK